MSRADNFDTGDGRWDNQPNQDQTESGNRDCKADENTQREEKDSKENSDEYLGGCA